MSNLLTTRNVVLFVTSLYLFQQMIQSSNTNGNKTPSSAFDRTKARGVPALPSGSQYLNQPRLDDDNRKPEFGAHCGCEAGSQIPSKMALDRMGGNNMLSCLCASCSVPGHLCSDDPNDPHYCEDKCEQGNEDEYIKFLNEERRGFNPERYCASVIGVIPIPKATRSTTQDIELTDDERGILKSQAFVEF